MSRKTKKSTAKNSSKAGASVVKAKYRTQYGENGTCGDALAKQLSAHVANKDGKVDLSKLRALAERNNVWNDKYSKLNAGMQRMTVRNRLAALDKVVWK